MKFGFAGTNCYKMHGSRIIYNGHQYWIKLHSDIGLWNVVFYQSVE